MDINSGISFKNDLPVKKLIEKDCNVKSLSYEIFASQLSII